MLEIFLVRKGIILLLFTFLVTSLVIQPSQTNIEKQTSSSVEQNFQTSNSNIMEKRFLQTAPITTGTGVTLTNASITKYSGLIIDQEIPLTWTIGQIYQVKGKLTTISGTSGTYVSFSFINTLTSSQKYYFSTLVPQGKTEWTLNVDTRGLRVGDYYLAFYSGLSGQYKTSVIYKLRAPTTQAVSVATPPAPTGCSLDLIDNKLVLKWNEDGKTPIQKLTFSQVGKTTVQYILSNFQSSFIIPHKDFAFFGPGPVTVMLSSAYSSLYSVSGRMSRYSFPWIFSFRAGYHHFSEVKSGVQLSTALPWKVAVGSSVLVQGIATAQVDNVMVIEEPQSNITYHNLTATTSKFISPGFPFSKILTLNKEGVYILQINSNTGLAIINRPIYVGNALPLLPDFDDMTIKRQNSEIIAAQPITLNGMRNTLFTLINQKRTAWGRQVLVLQNQLSILAQNHSQDMVNRNFIGHVNPDGEGPQQRATKAGIRYSISQNVAYNLDLVDAFQRLARSPVHLANMVNDKFTRVGLGIAKDQQGYLFVTQNYAGPTNVSLSSASTTTTSVSTLPSTTLSVQAQVDSVRTQVRNWMLANYPTIKQDPLLSEGVRSWQCLTKTQPIFDYIWNTVKYPANYLSTSTVTAFYSPTFTSSFVKDKFFTPPDANYKTFGLSAILQLDGKIQVRNVYAK